MTCALVLYMAAVTGVAPLPVWSFDSDAQGWTPNADLTDVAVQGGALRVKAIGPDPFLTQTGLDLPANPWQYVAISIKASKAGRGELFWSGETTGEYGGLSQQKSTPFAISKTSSSQEIILFPFWQTEGTIRQLRLDLYNEAEFEINFIRIRQWGNPDAPATNSYAWAFKGDAGLWRVAPRAKECFAPPLKLAIDDRGWAAVTAKSKGEISAAILWSAQNDRGMHSAPFTIHASSEPRTYNVHLQGRPGWSGNIVALGLQLSMHYGLELSSVALTNRPMGPALLTTNYLGLGDAINRSNKPARVVAVITNEGGAPLDSAVARLVLSPDLRFVESQRDHPVDHIGCGETKTLEWKVMADNPGPQQVLFKMDTGDMTDAELNFSEGLNLSKEDYVPQPTPIKTSVDVLAYYFPGWDKAEKWDCIRNTAPIRKPVLGYYNEGNPECIDWQIKWAVENGISGFLVDWYWCAGKQQLTQWFDAYRKAKYRDLLKVAVMWANHNPPNTHSAEDWRQVTRHWIDNYFNLPAYYKIDGKPAVFIWDPRNIRNDLKGSDAVKKLLDESQEMARQAGYPGMAFIVVNCDYSKKEMEILAKEGYSGVTNYHEWGTNPAPGTVNTYQSIVANAPTAWENKNAIAAPLEYYPVIDTGWDSRPWHGEGAMQFTGRNSELFTDLLQKGKQFAQAKNKKIIILGPVNEWGEGSYIEPCLEFGFSMYQAIRLTFIAGPMEKWPVNFGPRDVGLGPYDY